MISRITPPVISLLALLLTVAAHAQEGREITAPRPAYDAETPEVIRGRVCEDANRNGVADPGEPGVAGVSVSDGFSVASTDERGRFEIVPSADAVFVAITRPPGYAVSGSWYLPLNEEVNFALIPADTAEDTFTFVHVTDNHLSDHPASQEGLREFVAEVNALDPPPAFVFNTGDLINCSKQLTTPVEVAERYFKTYAAIMGGLEMPWYNVAGDHSDVGYRMDQFPRTDFRCGKAMYWEHLGPHYFSFEFGNLHLVSIDMVYKGGTDGEYSEKRWGRETMLPEHLEWLQQDLEHRRPESIVLTGSEQPLHDFIPDFEQLAREHDIRLQLVGNTHVVSYREKPVPSRSGGALSGTWWSGPCPDLSPKGYMVYRVDGGELECFYRGLGRQLEVTAPGFGARVAGAVTIRASLAQGDLGGPTEFSIDGSRWRSMARCEASFYRENYEATVDSTDLDDGLAQLRVRTRDGAEVQTLPLVIDNGNEDFEAPADGTLVIEPAALPGLKIAPRDEVTVLVNSRPIGTVHGQERHEIRVAAAILQRVNRLSFRFTDPGDGMTMREPHLIVSGEALSDPRQRAIRDVRLNHWSEDIVERAGAVVGEGRETSFAAGQNEFYFVLPE